MRVETDVSFVTGTREEIEAELKRLDAARRALVEQEDKAKSQPK